MPRSMDEALRLGFISKGQCNVARDVRQKGMSFAESAAIHMGDIIASSRRADFQALGLKYAYCLADLEKGQKSRSHKSTVAVSKSKPAESKEKTVKVKTKGKTTPKKKPTTNTASAVPTAEPGPSAAGTSG